MGGDSVLDTADLRKARGAFFTPAKLTDFLAEWAVRSPTDSILEPSCGEAAFLLSVGARLQALGAEQVTGDQLHGVELHEESARRAARVLEEVEMRTDIHVGNFFDFESSTRYDAVLGNPPYVRYQDFNGTARAKGQRAALAQGVRLTGLASSWAAFVLHAARFLNPDGRLGLVLPAELLSVNYAAGVRRFLMTRFAKVRLILFDERVFPGVLEEVVLLLAEGVGPTDHFQVYQSRDLSELRNLDALGGTWIPSNAGGKWTPALIPTEALESYSQLASSEGFTQMLTWGETYLGMVTGNNHYFTMTAKEAAKLKVPPSELLPISPPGSRHLRGLTFTRKTWDELAVQERRVYLFYPPAKHPSLAARRYIAEGEDMGVEKAYKCQVRSPWWRVPAVAVPDLFLTYMNHETPRLVSNRVKVRHLNSIHGVALRRGLRQLGSDLLPIATLNSVTLLGAEMVGRAYGGGILKLEPKEADVLPVPAVQSVTHASTELRAIRPKVATALRQGNLMDAVSLVDKALLVQCLGMTRREVKVLCDARERLFERRRARGVK